MEQEKVKYLIDVINNMDINIFSKINPHSKLYEFTMWV